MTLSIVIVDDDIYTRCPSLIISTVDKFASLPWNEDNKVIDLFRQNEISSAPDLIIQDELHLISGPLGTLTGLYETAIEHLCTNNEIQPKIIASTATTRAADDQITKFIKI